MNTSDLIDLLRRQRGTMPQLSHADDWQRLALREQERRATNLVQLLDDETLAAIAEGRLDPKATMEG